MYPDPESGTPTYAVFHVCKRSAPLYHVSVRILFCGYTPEDYAREKAGLETHCSFQTDPLRARSFSDDTVHSYPPELALGDDVFHFLDPAWDDCTPAFYEHCCLLVTNDRTCEIAWLVFGQDHADGIRKDLADFLRNDCCWHMIR